MRWTYVLLAITGSVSAAIHEKLDAVPRGWRKASDQLADDAIIELHVALQFENIDTLDARLHAISDPESATYGRYLGLGELHATFKPSKNREQRVTSWLESHDGVYVSSRDGNKVSFVTKVSLANHLLDASFALYTNGETTQLGSLSYSVPDHLSQDIDLITPTTYFGSPRKVSHGTPAPSNREQAALEKRSSLPGCNVVRNVTFGSESFPYTFVTSKCYPELYNIGGYTPDAKSGSSIAFPSFLKQVANYEDLKTFTKQYGIPDRNFSILGLVNGAQNNQNALAPQNRDEADLDSQTIISLAGKAAFIPNLQYKRNDNEPFLQFYQYLLSQPEEDLPWVISNSYADEEVNVPQRYATRACNMIAMLGMRGRTILAPSGDSGPGQVCISHNGTVQFTPYFPPSYPYATAVGGTQNTKPVVASAQGGGGFSAFFARPSYQNTAVSTYLSKHISTNTKHYYASNGYVNFSGRGFPDISANFGSPQFPVIINGSLFPGGGTSEASPIVASLIALLNDARFRAGKPAMGFINPWLYKTAIGKGLVDVTKGDAVGCPVPGEPVPKGTPKISYASWNATVGWDPVTGLGYPNFQEMLKCS